MKKLKIGLLVQLKSGGPKMTVAKTDAKLLKAGNVKCRWFRGEKLESDIFHHDELDDAATKPNIYQAVFPRGEKGDIHPLLPK